MNLKLPESAMRLVFVWLLLTLSIVAISHYVGIARVPFASIGGATFISTLIYLRYLQFSKPISAGLILIDRYALPLLSIWIIVYLIWCGLVLFSNPYKYEFNHGDAMFSSQTLWNLVNGMNPENSLFTMNGTSLDGEDARYANTHGYVSIFTAQQYWLPMALLTPLYSLFPQPPMHIFALQISIVAFGLPGVFWAVRQAGASKPFAVLSAIGYSLLPQIETQLFFKGYLDVLALGVMPWFFGALIGKRWLYACIAAIFLAAVSYPYTYFVLFAGVSAAIFLNALIPSAVIILIGWLMLKLDSAVFVAALSPYYESPAAIPSFVKAYVLDRTIGSLAYNVKVNSAYVLILLQGFAFIPLIAVRRKERWDMILVTLWVILGTSFSLCLFRSAGWEFQRNSMFIAPLFFMALVGCLNFNREFENAHQPSIAFLRDAPSALLFFSMASMIFVGGTMFNSPPLASHFPWGQAGQITRSEDTRSWNVAMDKLSSLVPSDASIAWRAGSEVQAYLTNRQHSWYLGREPDGVKYYIFIGKAPNAAEQQQWDELITRLRQRQTMKVLYDGISGKPLLVFENLDARPIPRNESLLGWGVLRGAFFKGKDVAPVVQNR